LSRFSPSFPTVSTVCPPGRRYSRNLLACIPDDRSSPAGKGDDRWAGRSDWSGVGANRIHRVRRVGVLVLTIIAWWSPIVVSYIGIPVSIAIAVTRYRLYEIDRIISRTLSYGAVLVILAGIYSGTVLILRRLLPVEGDISVAISTLMVAFAFLPLVRRTQRVVDRRFFRSRYDASVVVSQLATELRGSLDMDRLADRAVSVIQETFEPEDASMWIDGTVSRGTSR
jgi:hypothetical protein